MKEKSERGQTGQHANLEFPSHLPANPPAPSTTPTPRESLPGIGVGMNGVRWAYGGTGGHYSFAQRMQNAADAIEYFKITFKKFSAFLKSVCKNILKDLVNLGHAKIWQQRGNKILKII